MFISWKGNTGSLIGTSGDICVSRLRPETIQHHVLEATGIDLPVIVHDEIGSTSDWSISRCRAGQPVPFACFARSQTSGRGRRGKSWLMAPGASIAMSLCWVFDSSADVVFDASLLPLTVAMSIVRTLESVGVTGVSVKWPNDVFVNDLKIAGILIDAIPLRQYHGNAYIIGVGLNYDMSAMQQEMTTIPFTDVCRATGDDRPALQSVAERLIANIVFDCQNYATSAHRALYCFRDDYDYCHMRQIDVLLDDGRCLHGVSQGISDQAELCVNVDGEIVHVNSAQVSVRVSR